MRKPTLAILAAATVLGAGTAPASTTSVHTYSVPAAQLAFAVPGSWVPVDGRTLLSNPKVAVLVRENPGFGAIVDRLAQPDSPLKFVAVDPNVRQSFATNANVTVVSLGHRMTQSEFLRSTTTAYGGVQIRNQRFTLVRLPGGTAVRATLQLRFTTPSGTKWISIRQYAFMRGTSAVTITYTTLPAFERGYRADFVASARSIRFTG
jgi:hypothetical protein